MALDIYEEGAQALQVYQTGLGLPSTHICNVGMGIFATVANTASVTALGTDGAGPCTIILVHARPGVGALGHYAAHNPGMIIQGVRDMITALNVVAPSEILFAAGKFDSPPGQTIYENTILDAVRGQICPSVSWRKPANDVYGSCYYLPLQERVGLLEGCTNGGYFVNGAAVAGIATHNY